MGLLDTADVLRRELEQVRADVAVAEFERDAWKAAAREAAGLLAEMSKPGALCKRACHEALAALAEDIDEDTPPDQVIKTR